MIKIIKKENSIPDSLKIPNLESFPDGVPQKTNTTHTRRLEIINNGAYIDEGRYNERYKIKDIRSTLKDIYNNKCAFCEQKVEQYHVEHYRPKKVYYWLAFSWDNLLMACPTCNQNKGTNFDLRGPKAIFINDEKGINKLNSSSSNYDLTELPLLVNPEVTEPLGLIFFLNNGIVRSEDERFKHTISTCKIDRDYLNDERRKILDIFKRDIESALIENTTIEGQTADIKVIVRKFISDSKDKELQFLAFRRYAISNNWLNDIVKSLND
jgi:uncharacterized protein (TIGR02646 family)